jgi:hypothetical protein
MSTAKKKATGLAAFGAKSLQQDDVVQSSSNDAMTSISQDVKSSVVACTVRMPRGAWLKIQHLALDEGLSFQALAMAGLEAELKRRGLPGFD